MANQSTESGGGYGTVSDKQLVDIIYADKIKDGIIIDPENFITPDMGDYLRNNDYAKYLRDMGDGEKVNSDILNELFYLENPPTTEPGYNQNLGVFIVKSKPIIRGVDGSEKLQKDGQTAYDMNNYDGDTIGFTTEDIYDGDKPFTLGGITYASFKEYVKINTAYEGEFKVRSLGINTPEIPHYKVVPNYDNVLSQALDHKTGKELKGPLNGTYIYESREFSDDEKILPKTQRIQ
jgi:endonuclease YncB( thermonuclease family)